MKGRRAVKGHADLKGYISDWSGSPKQPLSPIASDNQSMGTPKIKRWSEVLQPVVDPE